MPPRIRINYSKPRTGVPSEIELGSMGQEDVGLSFFTTNEARYLSLLLRAEFRNSSRGQKKSILRFGG